MSHAVAGEIEHVEELDPMDVELIDDGHDDPEARVPWKGQVRILTEFGVFALRGCELGRTSIVAEGTALLLPGVTLTVELELGGERFQALVHVDASGLDQGRGLNRLRIGATSPRGNDLIATQVRRGRIALQARARVTYAA